MRHIRLLDFRTVIFFCYQTIGILNIGLEHPESDNRISDQSLNQSDYRISDSQKIIGCPPLGMSTMSGGG